MEKNLVSKLRDFLNKVFNLNLKSEVESRTQGSRPRTQKNFEAKDRPSRGQGQGPRTQTQVFSKKKCSKIFYSGDLKKKGLQNFFSGEKDLQKSFFRRSLLEETKKMVFADFPQSF